MKFRQLHQVTLIAEGDCPAEEEWPRLTAGELADDVAERYVTHASKCMRCGPLLRESADEAAEIAATFTLDWERQMAARLVASGAAQASSRTRWSGGLRMPVWAFGIAAVAVIAAGVAWYSAREASPAHAEQLIARAYTNHRTLDMRLGDAAYAEKSGTRGAATASSELLEAERVVTPGSDKHPTDPAWIAARARIALLRGHYEESISLFNNALQNAPASTAIQIDLATAYYHNLDHRKAVELLTRVMAQEPENAVAIFNRAVAEEHDAPAQAIADLSHYLKLSAANGWTAEARSRLERLQSATVSPH